jgi:hypothetical protein
MNMLRSVPLNANILETLALDWFILGFHSSTRHSSSATCSTSEPKCVYAGYII